MAVRVAIALHESNTKAVAWPVEEDEENAAGKDGRGQWRQGHTPDLVGVEREQRAVRTRRAAKRRAQGNQKSMGRQDEAAELEEMRVHKGGSRKTKPTHWAVQQCAGEPS